MIQAQGLTTPMLIRRSIFIKNLYGFPTFGKPYKFLSRVTRRLSSVRPWKGRSERAAAFGCRSRCLSRLSGSW